MEIIPGSTKFDALTKFDKYFPEMTQKVNSGICSTSSQDPAEIIFKITN